MEKHCTFGQLILCLIMLYISYSGEICSRNSRCHLPHASVLMHPSLGRILLLFVGVNCFISLDQMIVQLEVRLKR